MAAKKNKSNELKIIRVYDAPVKTVWEAWTDPKQAAKWWGPRGFTLTTHSKDLRPGGTWVYTMHGPDGTDYPNIATYYEVEKYAKLVYDHGASEGRPPLFKVTVLFSELKGKTKMDMTMTLPTPEAAEETRKFIKKANGDSTWDRLAEYLEKEDTGKDKFVINRAFDVPVDVMFEMWTDPKHFAKWLPPTGFKMEFLKADIRPGGSTFYCMYNDAGLKMYGRARYLEITKPGRIVYTQEFTDEKNDKTTRHPALTTWPPTMLSTILLTEEAPDRTRVTVMWEPHGTVTA
ncbi:MAG TPA: SRPBCC family protein, partial [Bdellovibrionales bacterium]|nr:SRPBCC family protein [Bdellovibrionales bacterium]